MPRADSVGPGGRYVEQSVGLIFEDPSGAIHDSIIMEAWYGERFLLFFNPLELCRVICASILPNRHFPVVSHMNSRR